VKLYHAHGHAFLVCPELAKLDPRHAEHSSRWPRCRRVAVNADGQMLDLEGQVIKRRGAPVKGCPLRHEHEGVLEDPEGHRVWDFYWHPGSRPPSAEELGSAPWLCECGAGAIWADLDDLYAPEHLLEVDESAPGQSPVVDTDVGRAVRSDLD
jgi:hypothetical protein